MTLLVLLQTASMVQRTHPNILRINFTRRLIVHNLIRRKESECIRVALEILHHAKDPRQVALMIACPRLVTIDRLARKRPVDVQNHVDSSSVEDGSAIIVVECRVDVVHADRVDTETLEHNGIAQANFLVGERIPAGLGHVASLASGLVVHADDGETLFSDGVDEVLALDRDWVDGEGDARKERDKRAEAVECLDVIC